MNSKKIAKKYPGFMGKLKGNFMGTEFKLYSCIYLNEGPICYRKSKGQVAIVQYGRNILRRKGPRTILAQITTTALGLNTDSNYIPTYRDESNTVPNIMLQNKMPFWDDNLKAFVMSFNERVKMPSINNFLLQIKESKVIVMQFGKIRKSMYSLNVQHPLSILQAFGICLSTLSFKLGC